MEDNELEAYRLHRDAAVFELEEQANKIVIPTRQALLSLLESWGVSLLITEEGEQWEDEEYPYRLGFPCMSVDRFGQPFGTALGTKVVRNSPLISLLAPHLHEVLMESDHCGKHLAARVGNIEPEVNNNLVWIDGDTLIPYVPPSEGEMVYQGGKVYRGLVGSSLGELVLQGQIPPAYIPAYVGRENAVYVQVKQVKGPTTLIPYIEVPTSGMPRREPDDITQLLE